MILKCPCKDCTKRTAECHAICDEYKEWSEARQVALSNKREENSIHAMMVEKRLAAKERYRRRHRW